ncbi:MAG: nucleotidyltransferase domain-containing protein [Bacteroides sp.]|nr:nucleotidyltransferase domain-containing protein [Bacteroides sp.]
MDILKIAEENQQRTWQIVEQSGVIPLWESIGATVYMVGSLRSGLLMKNRDIDIHIYTDQVSLAESFGVVQQLAERLFLRELTYRDLRDTEEECVEWHALHEDKEGKVCKLDMIHIRRGSKYDGVVEGVTEAIMEKLTPELRKTILQVKFEVPQGVSIPGIEIYHAVFTGGVRSYRELEEWRKRCPLTDSLGWRP